MEKGSISLCRQEWAIGPSERQSPTFGNTTDILRPPVCHVAVRCRLASTVTQKRSLCRIAAAPMGCYFGRHAMPSQGCHCLSIGDLPVGGYNQKLQDVQRLGLFFTSSVPALPLGTDHHWPNVFRYLPDMVCGTAIQSADRVQDHNFGDPFVRSGQLGM